MHFLPESPRILAARGHKDQARAVLRKVYSGASDEIIELKLRILDVSTAEMTKLNNQYSLRQRITILWTHKPYRRAILAVSGIQAFGQLTGYNSLVRSSLLLFFSRAAMLKRLTLPPFPHPSPISCITLVPCSVSLASQMRRSPVSSRLEVTHFASSSVRLS